MTATLPAAPDNEPTLILARHGETAWSREGKHTSRTDIPLTDHGVEQAEHLGQRLRELDVSRVFTSPLGRARNTATLAGFPNAILDDRLMEWDYGQYEGITSKVIWQSDPGWTIWLGAVPDGETREEVAARADAFIDELYTGDHPGVTLAFTHGHMGRMIAARWLHLDSTGGRLFMFDTARYGILSFEHAARALRAWNV